jgi:hypothetical protein
VQEDGYLLLALPIPADDREDLVQETVEKALASFKRNGLERLYSGPISKATDTETPR